jgi:hypothetical protein
MLFIGLLAILYLVLFVVTVRYANQSGKSILWWIFLSLILTPFIAFFALRNGIKKTQH